MLPKLPKLDFLPNPPHKGLPTPQRWGQTWDSIEDWHPIEQGALAGWVVGGGLLGAAIGVGIGMTAGPPAVAIPIALSLLGTGMTTGAGVSGIVHKMSPKDRD